MKIYPPTLIFSWTLIAAAGGWQLACAMWALSSGVTACGIWDLVFGIADAVMLFILYPQVRAHFEAAAPKGAPCP